MILSLLIPVLAAAISGSAIDETALEKALLAHVKTLPRPVSTFH